MNSQARSSILERITTIDLPLIQGFIPAEHFRTDRLSPDRVKIGGIDDDFRRLLASSGCQPIDVPPIKFLIVQLRIDRLTSNARTATIVAALRGGVAPGQILTFKDFAAASAAMWQMLKRQPNGDPAPPAGELLTSRYGNIFPYPEGAVHCLWRENFGWDLVANPVASPYEWRAGSQVCSTYNLIPFYL